MLDSPDKEIGDVETANVISERSNKTWVNIKLYLLFNLMADCAY